MEHGHPKNRSMSMEMEQGMAEVFALFTNIRGLDGTDAVIDWIKKNVLLEGC